MKSFAGSGHPSIRSVMVFVAALLWVLPICSQEKPKYQIATIMEVKAHQLDKGKSAEPKSYDVSLKVGKTTYVVLFTPPSGSYIVEYKAGTDLPVLVKQKTIKFNDMLGKSQTVPILSRTTEPEPTENVAQ
jgi:hypothetical protein